MVSPRLQALKPTADHPWHAVGTSATSLTRTSLVEFSSPGDQQNKNEDGSSQLSGSGLGFVGGAPEEERWLVGNALSGGRPQALAVEGARRGRGLVPWVGIAARLPPLTPAPSEDSAIPPGQTGPRRDKPVALGSFRGITASKLRGQVRSSGSALFSKGFLLDSVTPYVLDVSKAP